MNSEEKKIRYALKFQNDISTDIWPRIGRNSKTGIQERDYGPSICGAIRETEQLKREALELERRIFNYNLVRFARELERQMIGVENE